MSMILMVIISIVISGFIFGILGFLARMFIVGGELRRAEDAAEGQLRRAEARNREILVEAKENALKIKSQAQSEINNDRRGIQKLESSLEVLEENLNKQNNELHKKTNEVNKKEQDLESERKIKKKWYKKGLLNIFSTSEKSGKSRWTWSNGPSSWVNK